MELEILLKDDVFSSSLTQRHSFYFIFFINSNAYPSVQKETVS